MIKFIFTKHAEKKFLSLHVSLQERIKKKLTSLKKHDDIFAILKRLHHFEPATHRLRIGDFRLILQLKKQTSKNIEFLVLDIGDRKDVYK